MLPQEKLTVFIVLTELSFSINRLSIGPFIADLEIKINALSRRMVAPWPWVTRLI